jgi:hypothetical protein
MAEEQTAFPKEQYMQVPQGVPPAPEQETPTKKPRKPRAPNKPKETGKVTVWCIAEDGTVKATDKQPDKNLRTKKQLVNWISKNLGAGAYFAVRTIVKMNIEEETKVEKKVKVL